ncbi:MAG: hypothetical protein RLN60_01535, partial [Phycisphaerales bacterium]
MRHRTITSAAVLTTAALAGAGVTMPNECEMSDSLNRLYSYFGVQTFSVSPSARAVHSGDSIRVDAMFVSSFFSSAGFGLGTLGIAPPDLADRTGADTFSISVDSDAPATLAITVTIREDDNGDGVITAGSGDDEWESTEFLVAPGVSVVNIPYGAFTESDFSDGDGLQQFNTTGAMAYIINVESREGLAGGLVTTPTTLWLDHIGLYNGPQSISESVCAGDCDGSGTVDFNDLVSMLFEFGPVGAAVACDADDSGTVDFNDLVTA